MTPGPGIARTLLPKGFTAGGINSGVRRYRPDLGVLISETPAVVAGVFTQNECKAAPVLYSKGLLPASDVLAIVTNSGQANAATGMRGVENNEKMVSAIAHAMGCKTTQVVSASTGVIGQHLDIEKITAAIPELIQRRQANNAEPFALAILTTDLVPKTVSLDVTLSQGVVRITGICKGSGMIHPNMATMLGYLLTDAGISVNDATPLLKSCTDESFNMISVDGDSSTNDCVFLMANGASGLTVSSPEDMATFKTALMNVSVFLAKSIASDGEGATKLVEVNLHGSPNLELARKAARGVIMSPLVKTALHGESPNWGRILARLGAEGVPAACLDTMALKIQGQLVFDNGMPLDFNSAEIRNFLKEDTIFIDIDLKSGESLATAWGCDLSSKYVEINTEYLT